MYWKVIKKVQTAFEGISIKLGELTGTTAEWWRSHGRPPSTFNQQNTGKKWQPLEDWLAAVDLYEDGAKGAGVMLSEEINFLVRCKYTNCASNVNQREMVNSLITESMEGATEMNKKEFKDMNITELETARGEVYQGFEKHKLALEVIDQIIKERQQ